jgi:3-hydroxy-D-aspartate aldolase
MNGAEQIGSPLTALDTPALLIDADVLDANIATLAGLVKGKGVSVRPHVKSHKSSRIAAMQRAAGAAGFCCAKLGEAEVLAARGIDDFMITTPLRGNAKLGRLQQLLLPGRRLTVLVDDFDAVSPLDEVAANAGAVLDVVVEVDVGQNRCGVRPGAAALPIVRQILSRPSLHFRGLQGYHGSLQSVRSFADRRREARLALDRLLDTAEILRRFGIDVPVLTGGGTGTLMADMEHSGLNELQPGSYVFMDSSYLGIAWDEAGTPPPFRSSLSILAGVVSRPEAGKAIVDCGWKAASSDSGAPVIKGRPDLTFAFAGDEHGRITTADGSAIDLRPGDVIEITPSHCDTTVNLFDRYVVHRGGRVEAIWPVEARGRSD